VPAADVKPFQRDAVVVDEDQPGGVDPHRVAEQLTDADEAGAAVPLVHSRELRARRV